jgi:hypothetical protein
VLSQECKIIIVIHFIKSFFKLFNNILTDKCNLCDYKPSKITNLKLNYLNKHATKEEREQEFKFYCKKCDFGCFVEILLNRHLETEKHLNL